MKSGWPKAFCCHGQNRRPLELKVHLKLIAALAGVATVDRVTRRCAVYVNNQFYLAACAAGAERFDLDGKPAAR